LLPPQIQEQMNADVEVPPEVQQMMAQAEQAMAMVEERAAMVAEGEQDLSKSKEANDQAAFQNKLNQKELEKKIEELRRVKAEFDTHIIKEVSGLDEKSAAITAAGEQQTEGEPDAAVVAVAQAVRSLDDSFSTYMQQADGLFGELQAIANRKPVTSKAVREGGKLYSEVSYDDGETHRVEVNPDSEDVADA